MSLWLLHLRYILRWIHYCPQSIDIKLTAFHNSSMVEVSGAERVVTLYLRMCLPWPTAKLMDMISTLDGYTIAGNVGIILFHTESMHMLPVAPQGVNMSQGAYF